jgi:glycosyltransferase involved in cell wall biosynthesis
MEASIIIPAYNEEKGIAAVVAEINAAMTKAGHSFEVIVVDDGSTDGTLKAARGTAAHVLEHPVNRGYGQSILTGMAAAKYDVIVTIDADSSYAPEGIPVLLEEAQKFALVIGQRTGAQYRGRLLKYPARIAFRWLAEYISGESIPDINSGLRVFRKSAYNQLPKAHECRGFSFSTTTTLLFMAAGYSASFVPVEYRHRSGTSKINYYRDTLRALQIMLEIGIHFNPLKIVLPMFLAPLALSAGFLAAALAGGAQLFLMPAVVSFGMSLIIFGIGMILLQIKVSGH